MNIPARQTAVNGLAMVGFVALIATGMWLAVYSAQYIPSVVGRVGTAAVYLSSFFVPSSEEASLSVVPTASTTIPFGDTGAIATSTMSTSSTSIMPTTPVVTPAKPTTTVPGKTSTSTLQISGVSVTPGVPALPDLKTTITAVGYLATSSAESFVASSTVPTGDRPAIRFTIKNIGTKATDTWRFSASIPTQNSYVYASPDQQSLAPGDSIDYALGFDSATAGSNKIISVTADFENLITESDEHNNAASTTITILGS